MNHIDEYYNPDDVLTLVEAALYLRCHPKTLRQQAVKKLIPGKRVGYLWRFSKRRLAEWMREEAANFFPFSTPGGTNFFTNLL